MIEAAAFPWLVLVPLMSRAVASRRRAILAEVQRRPGIHVTQLAKRVGLGSGSFYAHLQALVAEGRVVVRRRGKFRLVFPADARIPRRLAAPMRLGAKARPVAEILAANPGKDLVDLIDRLPVARRAAYYHVARFVREGLFTTTARGRYEGLRATPALLRLLRSE